VPRWDIRSECAIRRKKAREKAMPAGTLPGQPDLCCRAAHCGCSSAKESLRTRRSAPSTTSADERTTARAVPYATSNAKSRNETGISIGNGAIAG
jgi:hypothetical protein